MSLGLVLLAAAVGGGTYAYAKSKEASNGQAAVAGVATGAGTAITAVVLTWILPFLVIATIIGVPAAGAYYYLNKDKSRKALGPGRDY
jgi:amino acid transporter